MNQLSSVGVWVCVHFQHFCQMQRTNLYIKNDGALFTCNFVRLELSLYMRDVEVIVQDLQKDLQEILPNVNVRIDPQIAWLSDSHDYKNEVLVMN